MKAILNMPLECNAVLRDGCWPMSRVAPLFEDQFMETGDVCEEFDENDHFVGHARDHPTNSFPVSQGLHEGNFIMICPSEEDKQHLLWTVRAFSNPNSNLEHLRCVLI